jgi:ABC-2 type transport system ATP-binding protein
VIVFMALLVADKVGVWRGAGPGRRQVVRDVSLQVASGELFGLLGPNGAGKTSLLSVLSGLEVPGSGEVWLEGKPLAQTHPGRVGLAPQDLAFYGNLTGRENLEFAGQLYGLAGVALRDRVERLLASVGLADSAGRLANTYSGGMQRRLNMALALVSDPAILFLDEPTVGVDPHSRNLLFEQIRGWNSGGLTIVYISHYMEEVRELCPRIAIMDHGQVVACDRVETLLARERGTLRALLEGEIAADLPGRLGLIPLGIQDGWASWSCQEPDRIAPELVRLAEQAGCRVRRLETRPADLQQVFLGLTGNALRDE